MIFISRKFGLIQNPYGDIQRGVPGDGTIAISAVAPAEVCRVDVYVPSSDLIENTNGTCWVYSITGPVPGFTTW